MKPRLLLLTCVCASSGPMAAADQISFARDIAPVLEQRCASCHLTGEEPGSMTLHAQASYGAIVNVPAVGTKMLRVKPGAPDESYLMLKLEGTQKEGARMPLGAAPIDDKFVRLLRDWISAGAAES